MEKLRCKIDIQEIGKQLAYGDDEQQASLINKFAYELKIVCKDSDLSGLQVCCISDLLDTNGIDLINSLAEFIKLRQENKLNN